MAQVNKIDGNVTGLRYALESSIGTLPGSPVWVALDPNSYADFGGNLTLLARQPIEPGRQRKKGVITDLDASGAFNIDFTQTNVQDLVPGFFYAAFRLKNEFGGSSEITNVDGTNEDYEAASGLDAFQAGNLVFASGFTNSANNGLKRVTSAAAASLVVAEDLVDETPPAAAKLVEVGFQGAAGDIDVDASGSLPTLTSTALDFTTLGLNVGEWIYVGGDTAATQFDTAANNGWKRISAIAANVLTIDKSDSTMITEANASDTIQLFYGRVIKNESDSANFVRQTVQFERTLGAPDDAQSSEIQAEYLIGSTPNQAVFNFNTADKINVDLSYVSLDHETIDGPTALKSGTRPTLVDTTAFNTSSDLSRIRLAVVSATNESPAALFAFVTEMAMTVNNNVTALKAIGTLGAFDMNTGIFEVSGNMTVFFNNVSAVAAVRNNSDVSLDIIVAKDNAGWALDMPLVALGDARANIELNQPITLPISLDAAAGTAINANMDHTLMMSFFDYLPDAASA